MIPKFRAWHNELGRMMSIKNIWFQDGQLEELELNDAVMNDYITAYPDEIELMQSTGLFDAFGTEIFEGDIITKNQGETFGVVRYGICKSSSCFYVEVNYEGSPLTYPINPNFSRYYKVASNIYEKPELLERKGE